MLTTRNNGIYTQYHDNPPRFQHPKEITKIEAESIRTLVYSTHEAVSSYIIKNDAIIDIIKLIKN